MKVHRTTQERKAFDMPSYKRQLVAFASDKDQLRKYSEQIIGYQISTHNIPSLWHETQGEGITIAVLDTGYHEHIDMQGSIDPGTNMSDSATIDDADSHSTHCSGIITANNNEIGIVGVAPKAKVISVKVLSDDGSGDYEWVANGIRWAVDHDVDIISMSLGGDHDSPDVNQAVKYAYDKNIPIIAAAGNYGDVGELDYPGRYAETISIGALDINKIRAGFSQTGPNLDFMAPGVNILSTIPINAYAVYSGTSMATPWAAGVVALMMAKHRTIGGNTPLEGVEHVREHLKKTAIDMDQAGKDDKTGYGLIDVQKAIEAIQADATEEPVEETPETPDFEGVIAMFNEIVDKINALAVEYNAKVDEGKALEEQLAIIAAQIAAYEEKATQINDILNA